MEKQQYQSITIAVAVISIVISIYAVYTSTKANSIAKSTQMETRKFNVAVPARLAFSPSVP